MRKHAHKKRHIHAHIKKIKKSITKFAKGFTILELIVIAAIIALISSIALSSLSTSRAKARDSKKIQEMKEMQTALELYQLDAGGYPQSKDGANNPIVSMNKADQSNLTMSDVLQGIVAYKRLPSIPVPAKGSGIPGDAYYYQTTNIGGAYACGGKNLGTDIPYIIYFTTELPQKLYQLTIDNNVITNVYCLTI